MVPTRSQIRRACSRSCVTRTKVRELAVASSRINCSTPSLASSSRADVGSSSSSISGWFASARASETRCCSPPERLATSRLGETVESDLPQQCVSDLCRAAPLRAALGRTAGWTRQSPGNRKGRCVTMPDAAATRAAQCLCNRTVEEDGAAGWLVEPVQQTEQRTLARAAGAHNAQQFAAEDFQRNVVHDGDASATRPRCRCAG